MVNITLKSIEEFLNNEEIREKVFGTKHPTLTPEFGNPHEFTDAELDEIFNFTEEIIKQPKILKPYKPRKNKMEQLSKLENEVLIGVRMHIPRVSPFPVDNDSNESLETINTIKGSSRRALKQIFPFNNDHLCRMEDETKKEVIERVLFTIRKAVEEERKSFFYKGFMFEDDYERDKLKYLVENGKEPIVLPQEDYKFLVDLYVEAMRKVLGTIFKEAYQLEMGNIDFGNRPEGEFFEFGLECAKRFPYFHKEDISSLSHHYVSEALYTKDISSILKEYHSLKTNVIVDELSNLKQQHPSASGWSYRFHEITSVHPERLFSLIYEDGFLMVMKDMLAYIKFLLGDSEEIRKSFPTELIEDLSKGLYYRIEKTLKLYYTKLYFMYNFIKEIV